MKKILIVLVTLLFISCQNKEVDKLLIKNTGDAFGTTYNIQYESKKDFHDEFNRVFERVNQSMSTYMPKSNISRINKGDTTIVVDEMFKEVFLTSKDIWAKTKGAFDPTVGPLVNAYGFGPTKKLKNIDSTTVDSLMNFVGMEKVEITSNDKIRKQYPEVYLDFNAIAKGYTLDLLAQMLDEKGISNFLIELGGEVVAEGINPEKQEPWTVGIDNPTISDGMEIYKVITLEDRAMASSGNYRKFIEDPETGQKFVHTINPETGWPKKSNVLSVTVLAENCKLADAYATSFMVMELEETKNFLNNNSQLDVFIIFTDDDGNLQEWMTEGFKEVIVE
ncbi:MAG: FAD:protein FMN transferase [Flavobacteriaceae bacterium]